MIRAALFPVIVLILSHPFINLVQGQLLGPSGDSTPSPLPSSTPTPLLPDNPTAPPPANCNCSVSLLRFSTCSLYLKGARIFRPVCCFKLNILTNEQIASCICFGARTNFFRLKTDTSTAVNNLLTACNRM